MSSQASTIWSLTNPHWEAQCELGDTPEDHDLAVEPMTGHFAVEAGVSILNEGTHSFTFCGRGKIHNLCFPVHTGFWRLGLCIKTKRSRFNEPHQAADGITSIATNTIPDDFDIVMTHGPPKGILDGCPQGHVGCENVLQALCRIKPMMHCFDHIHEGNGVEVIDWKKLAVDEPLHPKKEAVHGYIEEDPTENPYPQPFVWEEGRGNRTLAVNAAIMTGNNKPEQAPWLISLDLPCAL